jgi:hypothetical protein
MTPEARLVRMHYAQALLEAGTAYTQAVADNIDSEVARLERELGALVGPLQTLAADSTGAPLRFGDVVECLIGPDKGRRAVVVADEHLRHDDEHGRERLGPGPNARAIVGLVVEGRPTTTIHLLVRSDHDGTPYWRRVLATPVPMSDNGSTPGSARGDGRPSEDLTRDGVGRGDGRPSASTDVRRYEDRDAQERDALRLLRAVVAELHDDGISDATLDEADRVLTSAPAMPRHDGRVVWPIPARLLDRLVLEARSAEGVSADAAREASAVLAHYPAPSVAAAEPPSAQASRPSPATERGSGAEWPDRPLPRAPGKCADCASRKACGDVGGCWPGSEEEPIRVRVGRWARGEQVAGDSVDGLVVGDHGDDVIDVRSDATGTLYEAIPSYAEVLRSTERARAFTGWAWTRIATRPGAA